MNRKRIEKILHNCSKTIDESVNRVGASNEIIKYIEDLEQQVEKQKEAINKAIETLEKGITFCENDSQLIYNKCNIAINREKKVLDILKEVE